MLDVVAYICNYMYKFLDANLFMLDVLALAYSVLALAYSDTFINFLDFRTKIWLKNSEAEMMMGHITLFL